MRVALLVRAAVLLAVGAAAAFVDNGLFNPETYWWEYVAPNATPVVEHRRRLLSSLEVTRTDREATLLRDGTDVARASASAGGGEDAAARNVSSAPVLDVEVARRLQSSDCGLKNEYDTPCCARCQNLEKCRVLNGNVVEDKYYPTEDRILGSCWNFEEQAHNLDIFGPERTFRDTPQCRELVYDYICAFWASSNSQYDNRCISEPQYASDASHILRPCKSFCVMVAVSCANRVAWHSLCQNLKCPPKAVTCMPFSPYVYEAVDPSKACEIYLYTTPEEGWSGMPSGARAQLTPLAAWNAIAVALAAICLSLRLQRQG